MLTGYMSLIHTGGDEMRITNFEVQIEEPQVIEITEADGGIWAMLKPDALKVKDDTP